MPIEIMNAPRVVPVPHLPHLLLGARHAGAAAGAHGAEAAGREPARHRRSPSSSSRRPRRVRIWPKGTNQVGGWGIIFGALDKVLQARRALFPEGQAPERHRQGRGLRPGAPQRRGRARRHLPGHGQYRDDVPRARRAGRPSDAVTGPRRRRQAAGHQGEDEAFCQPCAVPGLGHGAVGPRPARSRGRGRGRGRAQPRLAEAAARCSTSRATGPSEGRTCGPAAGPSSTATTTIPTSTTRPSW